MDFNNTREKHRTCPQLGADDKPPESDDCSQQGESRPLSNCSHKKTINDFHRRHLTMSSREMVSRDEHHTLRSVNSAPIPCQGENKSRERRQRSDRTQTSPRSLLPPVSSQRVVAHDWRKNLDDIQVGSKPSCLRGKLDYTVDHQYLKPASLTVDGYNDLTSSLNKLLETNENVTKFTLPNGCSEFDDGKSTLLFPSLMRPPEYDSYKHGEAIHSYRSTYSSEVSDINMHGDGLNYTILPISGSNDSPAKSSTSSKKHKLHASQKSNRESPANDTSNVSRNESTHQISNTGPHISPQRYGHARHALSSNSLHIVDNLHEGLQQEYKMNKIKGLRENVPSNCSQNTEMIHEKQSARGDRKGASYMVTSTATNSCQGTKYSNVKVKPEKTKDQSHRESRSMPCTVRSFNASPTMPDREVAQHCHPKLKGPGSSYRSRLDSRSPTSVAPVHKKSPQSKPTENRFGRRKSFHSSNSDMSKARSPKHPTLAVKITPKAQQSQGGIIKIVDDLLCNVYNGKGPLELNDTSGSLSHYSLENDSSTETITSDNVSSCSFTQSPQWDVDVASHSSLVVTVTETNSVQSSARSRRRAMASVGSNNTSPLSAMISPTFFNALAMPQGTFLYEPSSETKADSASPECKVSDNSCTNTTKDEDYEKVTKEPEQNIDVDILKENIAKYAEPFQASPSSARSLKVFPKDTYVFDTHNQTIRHRSVSPNRTRLSPRQAERRNVQSATHNGDRLQTLANSSHSASRSRILLTLGSQSTEHTEKQHVSKPTKRHEKCEGTRLTQNSSRLQLSVLEHIEISQQHGSLSDGHISDIEVSQSYTPHRRELDTIDCVEQGLTPPSTPGRQGESKDQEGDGYSSTEEPLDLCLNLPHTPLHYTALTHYREKSIHLNEMGLIEASNVAPGIQQSTSFASNARERERNRLTQANPTPTNNTNQENKSTLNCENRGRRNSLDEPYEKEQYLSQPSIVEVALALRDQRVDMEIFNLPTITVEEIYRKEPTVNSKKPCGDFECNIIDIIQLRTNVMSQVNDRSEESDNESSSDYRSTIDAEIEEERCQCLKACWKAILFFFFNVRS